MIICRTPLRISFFGGGTDYPSWYMEHGGQVLATTINKYSYISCRYLPPFFEHKHRILYSKIECVKDTAEIDHPAVRTILKWMNIKRGLEIHYDGDLPARSGLGTSSAFSVGLINALFALELQRHTSKEELAGNAIHVEQKLLKENVGSQDQICAAYGGFNRIQFKTSGAFEVNPVILRRKRLEELQQNLMLFFTGFSRLADPIAKSQIDNFNIKSQVLKKMSSLVEEAILSLSGEDDIDWFGHLLNEAWMLKRSLSELVTTPSIDEIYELALKAGAIGGKLLGAGGGGFLLLFVRPNLQSKVKEALHDLIQVPFQFEDSGSKIVLYQPNGVS